MLGDAKIKDILLKENYVSAEDIKKAEACAQAPGKFFIDCLFSEDIITEDLFGQAMAEYFGVTYLNINREKIDEEVLNLIPELVASTKGVIAFSRTEKGIKIGMTNPADLETKHLVEKRVGDKVLLHYITPKDLEQALFHYEEGLKEVFAETLKKLKSKTISREDRDETTVEMVDLLLRYGYDNKASDVHIEPYEKKVLVRFRIDGVMHDVLEVPSELSELILTRIKILSKMRTDEHRAAQDGKLRFKTKQETVDVRVSVVPVTHGENVVMRLLSSKSRRFDLNDLGLSNDDMKKVKRAIKHPHGMILVTGPTGSGKTTSLYAVMKILNRREVNIATIEDPVEYDLEGVTQIQVNTKTGLTFAKGLRSLVRQDPDIIMVGEIRDEETAGIAVNSALTGHLVLSTLHTNDAATTLPRLLDMGIEPFLVASTVNVAIAQRLVRKICKSCRASYSLSDDEKKILEHEPHVKEIVQKQGYKDISKARLYKGAGCKVCGGTGYSGRLGIFEVLEMSDKIKELILKHASSDEITKAARAEGMITMMENGMEKVFNGVTTLEEVVRVASE